MLPHRCTPGGPRAAGQSQGGTERPTWEEELLQRELHPGGEGGQVVLEAVVEQEGVQREAARVVDGCHQILRVVKKGQGAHIPAEGGKEGTFSRAGGSVPALPGPSLPFYHPKWRQAERPALSSSPQPKAKPRKQARTAICKHREGRTRYHRRTRAPAPPQPHPGPGPSTAPPGPLDSPTRAPPQPPPGPAARRGRARTL